MLPLAQLNFDEMPKLKDYPQRGILQFYISDDEVYGLDFKNPFNQQTFRVVYFENTDGIEQETDLSFIKSLIKN